MEKLQGPINYCLACKSLDVGRLEEESIADLDVSYAQFMLDPQSSFRFEELHESEQEQQGAAPRSSFTQLPSSLDDRFSFLEMLQNVEYSPLQIQEQNHHNYLLRLQNQQQQKKQLLVEPWESNTTSSCMGNGYLANDGMLECLASSPVKSEPPPQIQPRRSTETTLMSHEIRNQVQLDQCHRSHQTDHKLKSYRFAAGRAQGTRQLGLGGAGQCPKAAPDTGEKRKRKRTQPPVKNKEEAESQRMAHIAVERNRRRQMNDHLSALRSLMPPSYVQRGDQASIVGGAIDFVKELEQLLQALEAQKRMRMGEQNEHGETSTVVRSRSSSTAKALMGNRLFMGSLLPQKDHHQDSGRGGWRLEQRQGGGDWSEELAEVEAVVIHSHVNVKIECRRKRRGGEQLVKVIRALESLRLTALHLNITSLQGFAYYSLNLKIEDECHLRSANEIAAAVHQIFSFIDGNGNGNSKLLFNEIPS